VTISAARRCEARMTCQDCDSEKARLMAARNAVLDAWQAKPYGAALGRALPVFDFIHMVDDAIHAVWAAEKARAS
jgi:hypothetical protein